MHLTTGKNTTMQRIISSKYSLITRRSVKILVQVTRLTIARDSHTESRSAGCGAGKTTVIKLASVVSNGYLVLLGLKT